MFKQREGRQSVACSAQSDLFEVSNRLQLYPPITRRFIVLVPTAQVDTDALVHAIWALAMPDATPVLYLGLVGHRAIEEDKTRLCLATLASLTRDDHVNVQIHIARETNWIDAVRQVWRLGDVVICQAEQMIPLRVFGRWPLWQGMESSLKEPVFIVSGIVSPQQLMAHERAERVAFGKRLLSGALPQMLIVAGFFYAQLRIDLMYSSILRTALLCASGVLEASLIGFWNSLIG
jgi:hypothetical protein